MAGALPVLDDQDGYDRYIDPEWVTVQFVDGISHAQAQNIITNLKCQIVRIQSTPGYYTVSVPLGMSVFEAVDQFMDLSEVKFSEPLYYGFHDLDDDTYLGQQWNLQNTGQISGYTPGNDINVFSA